jgi:hypothetical protein
MKRIGKEKETSVAMVVVIFCGGFHRRRRRTERRFIRNSRVCVVLGKCEEYTAREYVKCSLFTTTTNNAIKRSILFLVLSFSLSLSL